MILGSSCPGISGTGRWESSTWVKTPAFAALLNGHGRHQVQIAMPRWSSSVNPEHALARWDLALDRQRTPASLLPVAGPCSEPLLHHLAIRHSPSRRVEVEPALVLRGVAGRPASYVCRVRSL